MIKKYKIKSTCILGHSDIAPSRKKDPGEKFPWKYLSENKIGYWHNLNQDIILRKRNIILEKKEKLKFVHNLYKIGYSRNYKLSDRKYLRFITIAFQRRFRQQLVNGIIDLECLLISNNLLKKVKFS